MFSRDPLANPEPLIKRVYAYAAYRVGDGPDAEDVTSDTLERALRYRDSFDPRKGDPAAWLIGIARRSVDDFYRRRQPTFAEPPEAAGSVDIEGDTARRLELAAALARVDERERELIALRYGADLTARQIGEVLELSTNAVEVALHRALGRLREVLSEDAAAGVHATSEVKAAAL
ncbi:MAG: RNA polymerase sigma factor [Gaiellaceae bacterium]